MARLRVRASLRMLCSFSRCTAKAPRTACTCLQALLRSVCTGKRCNIYLVPRIFSTGVAWLCFLGSVPAPAASQLQQQAGI